MPTAVLILIVLGSLAVDLSLARLARQDLSAVADAAANDVTTVALDIDALRAGGTRAHPYDLATACDVIRATIRDNHNARYPVTAATLAIDPVSGGARVELRADVQHIFSPALDGIASSSVVAVGIAVPRRQPGGHAVPSFSSVTPC